MASPSRAVSRAAGLRSFRLIPAIEKNATLLRLGERPVGKAALLFIFTLAFWLVSPPWVETGTIAACLVLLSFLPEYRHMVLAAFPTAIFLRRGYGSSGQVLVYAGVLCLGALLFLAIRRWPNTAIAKRPVASLLTGFSLLIVAACQVKTPTLWLAVATLSSYVWFIAYALTDRSAQVKRDGTLEIATFGPVWGSTHTPYPKGAAYLRKIEAKTTEQFARVQLKALKLIVWALILLGIQRLWNFAFHVYLHIPTAAQALHLSVTRHPVMWQVRWESQILGFFEDILALAISGHVIIACCRMAGFDALRNTYRPLSSTTLAEFFNRYYYYFKELLVDFFFFPTYIRYWKKHKRLRLACANFAAACFGNAFFHFTRDWMIIRDVGLKHALANFQVFAFYTVALATGLTISQWRKRDARHTGWLRGRALPIVGVMLFYCLLNVFGATQRNYPLSEHLRFLASLFNPWM